MVECITESFLLWNLPWQAIRTWIYQHTATFQVQCLLVLDAEIPIMGRDKVMPWHGFHVYHSALLCVGI
jgi:hypothetical protein